MTGVGLDRNGGVMLVLPKGQRVTFSASEAESIWKGEGQMNFSSFTIFCALALVVLMSGTLAHWLFY